MVETGGVVGLCVARMHTEDKNTGGAGKKKTLMIVIKVFDLEARPGIEPGLTALQAAT